MKKVDEAVKVESTQEVLLSKEMIENLDVMIDGIFAKQIDLDNSKINLYVTMIDLFNKATDVDKMEAVLLDKIKVQGDKNNMSKAYVNKVKNIVKISKFTVIYKIRLFEGKSTVLKTYYYNIEKLVRLFEYLHTNYTEEEPKAIKKEIDKIIKIVDKKECNDALSKALTEWFKKYKIVLSDSGAIVKVTLTSEGIANFLKTLTPEQVEMVLQQASELDSQNKAK